MDAEPADAAVFLVLPGFVGVQRGESQPVDAGLPALQIAATQAGDPEIKAWRGSSGFGLQSMSACCPIFSGTVPPQKSEGPINFDSVGRVSVPVNGSLIKGISS